jgi:radical SAM superfamily enzyme YgiQ (UPF0313 family)
MSRTTEEGAIRSKREAPLPVALVFPNSYRVGMANLGFQYLYGYLNSHPQYSAERFFFAGFPRSSKDNIPKPVSEDWGTPLSSFRIIAFSISFEQDYLAVPAMLLAAGIPPLQKDRGPHDPIIIAGGGAVSLNPEPLAMFLDLLFIGEITDECSDDVIGFFKVLSDNFQQSQDPRGDRESFLKSFRMTPGAYVPTAYEFSWTEDGLIKSIRPQPGFPLTIKAVKSTKKGEPVPVSVLFSTEAEFRKSLLIETNRGCSRGCKFCVAGWSHFPVRYRKFEEFQKSVKKAIEEGKPIRLIGSDLAGHPDLERILEYIIEQGGSFSLSSIRPEGLTSRIIELIAVTGQKTATLAPEVATPKLKNVIGKEIDPARFHQLVAELVNHGIPNVRYYFMIGLPTEEDDDVHAIGDFVVEGHKIFVEASKPKGRMGKINVQVNPFVPKPWTPFQWAPVVSTKTLQHRVKILQNRLKKIPNVILRIESPRQALYQAILSRGDRRLGNAILQAALQNGQWSGALANAGLDEDFYALRERLSDEIFPWEVTYHGVQKSRLRALYEEAILGP